MKSIPNQDKTIYSCDTDVGLSLFAFLPNTFFFKLLYAVNIITVFENTCKFDAPLHYSYHLIKNIFELIDNFSGTTHSPLLQKNGLTDDLFYFTPKPFARKPCNEELCYLLLNK